MPPREVSPKDFVTGVYHECFDKPDLPCAACLREKLAEAKQRPQPKEAKYDKLKNFLLVIVLPVIGFIAIVKVLAIMLSPK